MNKLRKNGSKSANSLSEADLSFLDGKSILITGGTGSFGKRFTAAVLRSNARRVIILSRDELKQSEMAATIKDERLRFFLGDVRDANRLARAFTGVDFVVHAAALKQVPALEYNPFEAILTNVMGAQNVISAAVDCGVKRVVALSTDKAANPANLYGATKLCAEKLFVAGNSYSGEGGTRFGVVRYGNVVGSRGSVIPLYLKLKDSGVLPLTDERMTRFWITLDEGVNLVLQALGGMHGGEIFVPKIASMKIVDLAKVIGPKCKIKSIGIRPGEKIHECLLTEEEAMHARDIGHLFVIEPNFAWWDATRLKDRPALPAGFRYASDNNDEWLTPADLRRIVDEFVAQDSAPARAAA